MQIFASTVVFALGLLLAGCAMEPPAGETIRQRMEKHPEEFRRVEILPLWFTGKARTDVSMTTNDLAALNHRVATNVRTALGWVLAEKGYEIVRSGPVLCSENDLEAFDADTRRLLAELRTNLTAVSMHFTLTRPSHKATRLGYTLNDQVTELRKKLGLGEADLLVQMESEAFFESPDVRHKRVKSNWIEGSIAMPLFIGAVASGSPAGLPLTFSPEWRQYSILVADARTREVLFWNARKFPTENARNPDPLKGKIRDTLADLAQLPK